MGSMWFSKHCRKAEITDFHLPLVAVDEDIVTLEISVDYRGIMAMEIEKPTQYLSAPMLNCPNVNSLVLLPIPIQPLNKTKKGNQPRLINYYISITHLVESTDEKKGEKKTRSKNRGKFCWHVLFKGPGSEHFGHEIDVSVRGVNPRGVELHYAWVFERLEQMDFAVEPLEIFGALQEIVEFDLVPSNFDPLVLVKCSVTAINPHNRTPNLRAMNWVCVNWNGWD